MPHVHGNRSKRRSMGTPVAARAARAQEAAPLCSNAIARGTKGNHRSPFTCLAHIGEVGRTDVSGSCFLNILPPSPVEAR